MSDLCFLKITALHFTKYINSQTINDGENMIKNIKVPFLLLIFLFNFYVVNPCKVPFSGILVSGRRRISLSEDGDKCKLIVLYLWHFYIMSCGIFTCLVTFYHVVFLSNHVAFLKSCNIFYNHVVFVLNHLSVLLNHMAFLLNQVTFLSIHVHFTNFYVAITCGFFTTIMSPHSYCSIFRICLNLQCLEYVYFTPNAFHSSMHFSLMITLFTLK